MAQKGHRCHSLVRDAKLPGLPLSRARNDSPFRCRKALRRFPNRSSQSRVILDQKGDEKMLKHSLATLADALLLASIASFTIIAVVIVLTRGRALDWD